MKNHLQEAEALFAGLSTKKKPQPEPESPSVRSKRRKAEAAKPDADGRRRRRIVPGATVVPSPLAPAAEPEDEDDDEPESARTRMSEAIRDLGGDAQEQRRPREALIPLTLPSVENSPSAPTGPEDAFLVRVHAPGVEGEELVFVLEGADVAGVADRALSQVGGYMHTEHGGVPWDLRSIERIKDVCRPVGA